MRTMLIGCLALAACSSSHAPRVRFVNAPVAARVNDRIDVPKPPRERPFYRAFYHFDSFYLVAIRALDLVRDRRALGVNAIDEVPDSTWFTNRIGHRPLTPDDIRRGPARIGPPDQHFPWMIKQFRRGRAGTLNFVAEDSRGVTFMLKLDDPGAPEIATGADAIVSRLMWAVGYNVPEDHIVYFRHGDLQVASEAGLTDGRLDTLFAEVNAGRDGRFRALASIYIEGTPLGGIPRLGVRSDDPNDRIPHELRRDQRGLHAIFAWLAHTDVQEGNSLDIWQADPANNAVHYVVHYLLDFDGALGAQPAVRGRRYIGHQYEVDITATLGSIMSFGLHRHDWESRDDEGIPGVGLYSDTPYDPGKWKPLTFAYLPLLYADRFDKFWGSKILIRFTRAQLAMAVESGQFSDPRAAPYLVETLVRRQRRTARHWFRTVNPIDEFVVAAGQVCFTDLALRHNLETVATRYIVTAADASGHAVGSRIVVTPDAAGRACVAPIRAPGAGRYTILRVDSSRGLPGTNIHLADDPASRQPRIIGIHRL